MAVILIGAGGHASVVADALAVTGVRIAAVCAERGIGASFAGQRVQSLEALPELRVAGHVHAHVAIGQPMVRARLGAALSAAGFRLCSVVHPRACVSPSAEVGEGAFIAAGVIIAPGVRIGARAIINHRCSLDHDTAVGEDAHLAPGVLTGGHARIGARSWVGLGAVLRDRAVIGAGSFIGAGSLVLKSIPEAVLAYGQPARVVRSIAEGDWPYP
ncbi:MAG: NeuD/PglB/VioB family sugar acetyltransferase [Xanthomonadales bacterium]|nr:NeuD/PglB/VioB family sugar acetyltransferase [Xanthomonadales bacterium]